MEDEKGSYESSLAILHEIILVPPFLITLALLLHPPSPVKIFPLRLPPKLFLPPILRQLRLFLGLFGEYVVGGFTLRG